MKTAKILAITLIVCISVLFACQKHIDVSAITPPPKPNPTDTIPPVVPTEIDIIVTTSIQGLITDQDGIPMKDATVTSGSVSVQTNDKGIFRFYDIPVSKYFGNVRVAKTGYFNGSRTIVTSTAGVNYLTIELIPRIKSGSLDAVSGGMVANASGMSVTLPANGVVMASSNNAYTGSVDIYSTWLDPGDPRLSNKMPGDLRGRDTLNRTVSLQTFGMLAVEMEGVSGEKLQLASGKSATISLPIPAKFLASAPAIIPLWYFNDSTGKWIEQGMASKIGSSYVGTVHHFTYWNFDLPSGLVYFNLNLKDQDGNPLAYTGLTISNTALNDSRTNFSDSLGNINGWLPKNATLSFVVTDNCSEILLTKSEGPFSTDQDVGTLTIFLDPNRRLTVHGTALDCLNRPLENGFVNITLDGVNYGALVMNGEFSTTILRCSVNATQLQIRVGDYSNMEISDSVTVPVSGNDVNTGLLTACGVKFDQYFIYNIDGNTYTIPDPPAIFNYQTGFYHASDIKLSATSGIAGMPGYQNTFFVVTSIDTGTRMVLTQSLTIGSTWYSNIYPPIMCTVTRSDGPGGYIQGSFSGNMFIDSTGAPHAMAGSFKVKRP